jgi:predicted NBD/HSP70 family sugar kinase
VTTLVVDVGATRTRLAIVRDGDIVRRMTRLTADLARPIRGVTDELVASSRDLVSEAGEPTVDAVGVGLAASVGGRGGVLMPRDFGIPAGPLLRDALADVFGAPVAVDNDANLAALAECRLGVGVGRRTVAVLTLGTNIGLGIVLDGTIHRGAHGAAGEAGLLLVPVTETGRRDGDRRVVDAGQLGRAPSAGPAGYAWIEELVGGGVLAAAARSATTGSGTRDGRALTADALAQPALRSLADRAIEGWALLIANLTVILDPDLVVLSGGLALDAAHLIETLRLRLGDLVPFQPEILLGSVGPDAELLGADLLAHAALRTRAVGDARAGLSAHTGGG